MKLVKQSYNIINEEDPMKHIEQIARVCYKSEDRISDGTDKKMIKNLYKNGHTAMLEHYRFIMVVNEMVYEMIEKIDHPFIKMTHSMDRYVISTSATALINMVEDSNAKHHGILPMAVACIRDELMFHIIKKYECPELFGKTGEESMMLSTPVVFLDRNELNTAEEYRQHMWWSVKFVTDRGISHELVRHRPASFAQESTRYCNYGNKDMEFIDQGDYIVSSEEYDAWTDVIIDAEETYKYMISTGIKPQFARSVLPNSLKTEIIVTATLGEWDHIFSLRCDKPAHPQMRDLMMPLSDELRKTYSRYLDDCWTSCKEKGV